MRAALYARVSTFDQEPENQLAELRQYAAARGWTATEYVDRGISGAKDRRPALDAMLHDARRRKVDVVVCWRLDRLGRNLRHLITVVENLSASGVGFVTLGEAIDTTTPAGRLQLHLLGALAEFERDRIRERVMAGLQRARAQGKRLGLSVTPGRDRGAWGHCARRRACLGRVEEHRGPLAAHRSHAAGGTIPLRDGLTFAHFGGRSRRVRQGGTIGCLGNTLKIGKQIVEGQRQGTRQLFECLQ